MDKKQMKKSFLASAVALAISPQILASTAETIYVVPTVGGYGFDGERQASTESMASIGLGYELTKSWATELVYSSLTANRDDLTNQDLDVDQIRLDALYSFAQQGRWQPFLIGGAGDSVFQYEGFKDNNETLVNLGAGVKYLFSDEFSIRSDVRGFQSLDENLTDYGANVSLQLNFGGNGASSGKNNNPLLVDDQPITKAMRTEPVVADADQDGVADANDQCLDTKVGVAVNNLGCDRDDDGDGIANYVDSCPDSKAGSIVDEVGCYIPLKEKVEMSLNVEFDNDSAQTRKDHLAEIARIADFMQKHPDANVMIEGHSDSVGASNYNKVLSDKRAHSILDTLATQFGIDVQRIKSMGYGEEKPIANNDTEEGRQKNRRVVAVLQAEVEKPAK